MSMGAIGAVYAEGGGVELVDELAKGNGVKLQADPQVT